MAGLDKIVLIYHGGCVDGFTALWAAHRGLAGRYELSSVPGEYNEPPPAVDPESVVLFLDFCYKREVMLELARNCAGIIVLDHHATAIEDMRQDLRLIFDWSLWTFHSAMAQIEEDRMVNDGGRIYTMFDDRRSGAGLAWDQLVNNTSRPLLIDHVEDRDLWRFQYQGSKAVHAWLTSYPQTLEMWDRAYHDLNNTDSTSSIYAEGDAILRAHLARLDELLPIVTRPMHFQTPGGVMLVPVANLPHIFASDAGHALLSYRDIHGRPLSHPKCHGVLNHPFAASYYDSPTHRVFSLRGRAEGVDVGAIAVKYGGGGHRNSSGFKIPRGDDPADFEHITYSTWELMQ